MTERLVGIRSLTLAGALDLMKTGCATTLAVAGRSPFAFGDPAPGEVVAQPRFPDGWELTFNADDVDRVVELGRNED